MAVVAFLATTHYVNKIGFPVSCRLNYNFKCLPYPRVYNSPYTIPSMYFCAIASINVIIIIYILLAFVYQTWWDPRSRPPCGPTTPPPPEAGGCSTPPTPPRPPSPPIPTIYKVCTHTEIYFEIIWTHDRILDFVFKFNQMLYIPSNIPSKHNYSIFIFTV